MDQEQEVFYVTQLCMHFADAANRRAKKILTVIECDSNGNTIQINELPSLFGDLKQLASEVLRGTDDMQVGELEWNYKQVAHVFHALADDYLNLKKIYDLPIADSNKMVGKYEAELKQVRNFKGYRTPLSIKIQEVEINLSMVFFISFTTKLFKITKVSDTPDDTDTKFDFSDFLNNASDDWGRREEDMDSCSL